MKRKGICYVCGCTHFDPCEEGCAWVTQKQTLCTSCVDLNDAQRSEVRAAAVDRLAMEHAQAVEDAEFLALRLEVLKSETKPQAKVKKGRR